MEHPTSKHCLLLGLPAVGKSTFLAALWHLLSIAEISTKLRFHKVIGDHSHLDTLCEKWLNTLTLERTKLSGSKLVAMELIDPTDGQIVTLSFPDLDGESFETQWIDHVVQVEYADLVGQASGGLFMLHPERVLEESLISEAQASIAAIVGEALPTEKDDDESETEIIDPAKPKPTPWDAQKAPTQLQVVEVLQVLAEFTQVRPFPLAVVVSAWDTVQSSNKSPSKWMSSRLPLVMQFLEANPELFVFKIFGISAQGDDYARAESLRQFRRHSERIKVVADGIPDSHDLTLPLRWLLKEYGSR